MNIFLLWRERASARERIDPGDVARRLRGVFSPYFDELPAAGSRALPASRLVSLDLPVGGFTPAAHGVDDGGWAYAPQCPIDATRALPRADAGRARLAGRRPQRPQAQDLPGRRALPRRRLGRVLGPARRDRALVLPGPGAQDRHRRPRRRRRALELLTNDVPSFLRRPHRDRAREAIRGVIREADRYGLTGLRRWDFFNLFEDTRRWGAAAQAAKPGFSITPFLNPGFIRASFAHPDEDKTDNPFHRFIVASLRPSWSDISYADELAKAVRPARPADADAPARPRWQTPGRRRFYDTALYWEDVAQPILADALAQDGFWTEVFDPALARRSWREEPDELAVVCLLPEALAIAGRDADAEVAQRQRVQA